MHYQAPGTNIIYWFGPDDEPEHGTAAKNPGTGSRHAVPDAAWQAVLDQAIMPALAVCHDRLTSTGRDARFAQSSPVPNGAPYAAVLWTPKAAVDLALIALQFVCIAKNDIGFVVTITREEDGIRYQAPLYARRFDIPSEGALELMLHVASEGLGYGIAYDTRHGEPDWQPQGPRRPR